MPVFATNVRVRSLSGIQRTADVSDTDVNATIDGAEADIWTRCGGPSSKTVADDGTFIPLTGALRTHFIRACEYQSAAELLSIWILPGSESKIQYFLRLADDKAMSFRNLSGAGVSLGRAGGSAD